MSLSLHVASCFSFLFFGTNVQKLDFVQLGKVTNGLCNLFPPYECGRVMQRYFLSSRGRHIKKNGNIISETELMLLQFYVPWEIIVS